MCGSGTPCFGSCGCWAMVPTARTPLLRHSRHHPPVGWVLMRRRTPPPPSPLPQRDGVDPVRVRLPIGDAWATVRDHLVARLAAGAEVIDGLLEAGQIVDAAGRPVTRDMAYVPGMFVWFHREL